MDTSSEIAMLRQTLTETQAELSRAQDKIRELEQVLCIIQEDGTEEHNAAVHLRTQLAQALLDVDHWKRVAAPWKVNMI